MIPKWIYLIGPLVVAVVALFVAYRTKWLEKISYLVIDPAYRIVVIVWSWLMMGFGLIASLGGVLYFGNSFVIHQFVAFLMNGEWKENSFLDVLQSFEIEVTWKGLAMIFDMVNGGFVVAAIGIGVAVGLFSWGDSGLLHADDIKERMEKYSASAK